MKISKLFHWLYACLMFLPIMVFLPSILYYGFNKEAIVPQVVDIQYNYKYQTNEVNSVNDLVNGNIYYANHLSFYSNVNDTELDLYFLKVGSINSQDYDTNTLIDSGILSSEFNSLL